MANNNHKIQFEEYYQNNKGTLYKSFKTNINNIRRDYDIYWGDPEIIFDKNELREYLPLAVTIINQRYNRPNPRIFLHNKLEKKYKNTFEIIIAHEIGHIWLYDVVGYNNPMTRNIMSERDSEIWADYFSYQYYKHLKRVSSLEDFCSYYDEIETTHKEIYNLKFHDKLEIMYGERVENLFKLEAHIRNNSENEKSVPSQMTNAIAITLDSLSLCREILE